MLWCISPSLEPPQTNRERAEWRSFSLCPLPIQICAIRGGTLRWQQFHGSGGKERGGLAFFFAGGFSGRHPEEPCSCLSWSKSIRGLTELYSFKERPTELLSAVCSEEDSSVPQVRAKLLIMILGMFAHFAQSSLITALRAPHSLSLKTDRLCSISLIHIVPFKCVWGSE